MTDKKKTCPFCGEELEIYDFGEYCEAECEDNCGSTWQAERLEDLLIVLGQDT